MENRERLERQTGLITPPDAVAVVGCGGVGSWCAYLLALAGVKELYLFDPDTLSANNRNRVLCASAQVGQRKSAVVADIAMRGSDAEVFAFNSFTCAQADMLDLQRKISWLVCTTDTLASRQLAYSWCVANCVCYVEAAAEGEYGSFADKPAEWATPAEAHPGYAHVPVWAGPCVFAATLAVQHVLHGVTPRDSVIRLGWKNGKFNHYAGRG